MTASAARSRGAARETTSLVPAAGRRTVAPTKAGRQQTIADLLAHGLVDELHLMIGPKIVAGDHHAFDGVAETDLRLIGVRTWGGSDNVVLSYGLGGSPLR